MSRPGVHYSRMTPEEQRAVDERDVAILDMLARGCKYVEIEAELGVTAATIARTKRACLVDLAGQQPK